MLKFSLFFTFTFLILLLFPFPGNLSSQEERIGSVSLRGYDLTWELFEAENKIRFKYKVRTSGWVGLGLNENIGMNGAQLVMAGVTTGGENGTHIYHHVRHTRIKIRKKIDLP